jgi:Uma2 family endonuclease
MIAVIDKPKDQRTGQEKYPPQLESGDHLTAREFLRRYEAMPEVKKAELVGGIVYMASPIRIDQHGEPDNLIQTWIGNYSVGTPGVKSAANSTARLGSDDVLQPDALLRILPEFGGSARVDEKGLLQGPPEFVVEIAASSVSIDTREKLNSYRRAGVREYVVWRTQEKALDWWSLEGDDYVPLIPQPDGTIKSRVFPGLWLDVNSLLAGNGVAVIARLQEGLKSPEHKVFVESLQPKVK